MSPVTLVTANRLLGAYFEGMGMLQQPSFDSTGPEPEGREQDVRLQPRKTKRLPCGSKTCLRCHKDCGVIMAAYLGIDFDEDE